MILAALVVIGLVLVFGVVYLLLLRPSSRRKNDAEQFSRTRFAHRGLYDDIFAENTLEAFLQAKESGYGIELDVRLTKDRQVVVFHDDTLLRAAGRDAHVSDLTYAELSEIPLFGTDAHIPLFSEVLLALKNTPLLVELKCNTKETDLAEKTAVLLAGYRDPYAIESFNPLQLVWFRKNRPDILRGQLVPAYTDMPDSLSVFIRFALSHMLFNWVSRPDFLAWNLADTGSLTFWICRLLYHPVLFAWTVRTKDEMKTAENDFATIIFERIRP